MSSSADALLALLEKHPLLSASQLAVVRDQLRPRFPEAAELAAELRERGWLTDYQIQQLWKNRGDSLFLGPYVLLEPLGEGGMGQVFRARQRHLDRMDAVKVIKPESLNRPGFLQRFQREARAAARLHHANVATVYTADECNGRPYLAMEFVEGVDLQKLVVTQGPLPVASACEYIRQAALGLQHAHEKGLVHRDIKPSNLLLTADGTCVKVLDMGLARVADRHAEGDPMTEPGQMMGTPDFMAPEQAMEFHKADIRADIYSLGCTLYYLLTAQVPFPGGQLAHKVIGHMQGEPEPLENLRPDLPAGLPELVRKMMAKKPEQRFQTPLEVAQALLPFLPGSDATPLLPMTAIGTPGESPGETLPFSMPETPPPLPPPPSPWPTRILVLVIFLALAAALLAFLPIPWENLFSRDGPVPTTEAPPPLLSRELRGHTGPVLAVAFAPGSELLVSGGRDRTIRLWEVDTGRQRFKLEDRESVWSVTVHPDGERILTGSADGTVRVWRPGSKQSPQVVKLQSSPIRFVAVSPDGTLALSGGGQPLGVSDCKLRLWELDSGQLRQELEGHSRLVRGAFLPSGKEIVSGGWDRLVKWWDLSGKELRQVDLTDRVDEVTALAVAPDGQTVALGGPAGVYLLPRSSENPPRSLRGPVQVSGLAFSPDGETLAVGSTSKRVQLWSMKQGTLLADLGSHGDAVLSVAFAPNGRWVASAGADGLVRLWEVPRRKP